MAGSQRNGVDATIALLLALARHNGEARASILQREIGAPRSSFHRIVRTLTATGILESPRGLLSVGRIAESLIAANAAALSREGGGRTPRGSRSGRRPTVSRTAEALDPGRVALSRAITPRRPARFRIGFSNASMDNSWRVALVHGIEHAAAAFGDGIERLTVIHAKDDPRQQEADIRAMIDQ